MDEFVLSEREVSVLREAVSYALEAMPHKTEFQENTLLILEGHLEWSSRLTVTF